MTKTEAMKKNLIIFFVIFVILIAVVAIFFYKNAVKIDDTPTPILLEKIIFETKENNEGPVSVVVTPRIIGNESWDFDIALNTHSEELNEDLVAVSELVDEQGRSYKPTSWEGAPPGGHHREGILKFNPISPKPKSLELKIKNVGGVTERSFKWNL